MSEGSNDENDCKPVLTLLSEGINQSYQYWWTGNKPEVKSKEPDDIINIDEIQLFRAFLRKLRDQIVPWMIIIKDEIEESEEK